MFRRYLLSALAAGSAACLMAASPTFAPKSALAEGRWVKVAVEETGVYEISYDELRSMGFSDPSKVSVFGRGGQKLPENFVTAASKLQYSDDIEPIAILHRDGKIYFYGQGVDNFQFEANKSLYPLTQGQFVNKGRNIYSRKGYYFLSDSRPKAAPMRNTDVSVASRPLATTITSGTGLVWHEEDLTQNSSNTGQLFWGESLANPNPNSISWPAKFPDIIGQAALMECVYYSQKGLAGSPWVEYGVAGGEKYGHIPIKDGNSLGYLVQEPRLAEVTIPGQSAEVFVRANPCTDKVSALDYWSVTYPKGIPTLQDPAGGRLAQDMIVFPYYFKGETLRFELPDAPGLLVFDITNPLKPVNVPVEMISATTGEAYFKVQDSHPKVVVFDTGKPQLQVSGYTVSGDPMANQNLHAMQEQEWDMAIIALPWLMDQAEEIAEIHRQYDGMNVAVASSEQVYNEFSGGVPDPMAYRAFTKMLFTASNGRMRNLLLMGPVYGDMRGMKMERDLSQGLIAYQGEYCSVDKGAFHVNDFYGMMDDYLGTLAATPEKETVHVGVGLLPCYFPSEADRYVDKLRRFYDDMDAEHASIANRRLNIGCEGDNHTHDRQAQRLSDYAEELTPGLLTTTLPINDYGRPAARAKTLEAFNNGTQLVTYIGHGGPDRLTMSLDYFNYATISELRNSSLPVMFFAGCLLSNCDRGQRGLGEAMVLDTPNGLIASILATRDTWSTQNEDFLRQFNRSLSREGYAASTPVLDRPRTLGEVYAASKTASPYSNELAYLFIGDPAITLPMVTRTFEESDAVATEVEYGKDTFISIKGNVAYYEGDEPDASFNGRAVARLLAPAIHRLSDDIVIPDPGTDKNPPPVFEYADEVLSMSGCDIVDGQLKLDLPLPQDLIRQYVGQELIVNLTGFNPETKSVMGWTQKVTLTGSADAEPAPSADTKAPVIESLAYDAATGCIEVVASDDVALNLLASGLKPGLRMHLDGAYHRGATESPVRLLGEGAARMSRRIYIGDIAHGTHTARVEVADPAGNVATSEIEFEVGAGIDAYALSMAEEALTDRATFSFRGTAPATARFTVQDAHGNTVYTSDISASSFAWDGLDNAGNRVAPGRYKAFVVETGSHQTKGHSNVVDVPVI